MKESGGCPLCGSRESGVLYADARDRLGLYVRPFNILKCRSCGSARLDEVPSGDELKALYPAQYIIKDSPDRSAFASFWSRLEMGIFYDRMYGKDVRELMRRTGLGSGRLLDVGCGNGRRMREFHKAGFEVEGLDTSQVDVEYVRRKLGFRASCGTLEDFRPAPGGYDAVTFYNVFEHLPDPAGAARKVHGMLKPGGWIAAFVPTIDGLQARLFGQRWIEIAEMPRHIFIPSTSGMKTLLESCGFVECRVTPVSFLNLAFVMAESLMPHAIGAEAYKKGGSSAVANRASGALVMLLSLPFALIERHSGRASSKVFWARKPR